MELHTTDNKSIVPFLKQLHVQEKDSHKGQNGRVLIIGGSSLFHASSIWAAEVASRFVDIVHFASTEENNQIFYEIKKKYHNGIVVSRTHLEDYAGEDDSILIGPGMVRSDSIRNIQENKTLVDLLSIKEEAIFTGELTYFLLTHYPDKKFVLDAGALQMMKPEWLKLLKIPALITPHQLEFERLFGIDIKSKQFNEKIEIVKHTAAEYKTTILLKAVDDIVSDGKDIYIIKGGNQGLTKGGTGDILAGLCSGLYAKNDAVVTAVVASYLLKKTADNLLPIYKYWYNNDNLIAEIPATLATLYSQLDTQNSTDQI